MGKNDKKSESKPLLRLLPLLLPIIAGGMVVLLCAALALVGLARMHESNSLLVKHDMPLAWASQEAANAMQASQTALAGVMEKDGDDTIEEASRQEAALREGITRGNVVLAGMMWGSESNTFLTSDGGVNKIEWQFLKRPDQLKLMPPTTEQAQLIGHASIYFAGYANNARKAMLAQKQAIILTKMGRSQEAAASRQEALARYDAQAPYAASLNDSLGRVSKQVSSSTAAHAAYADAIFTADARAFPLLVLLAIVGMLALGVTFVLRQVIRPVLAVQASFATMAAGQLTETTEAPLAQGPLGPFTKAFNAMLASLKAEVSSLRTTLAAKSDALEKHDKSYEQTKRAIINLLQDAQSLEAQLKSEKANVEKKIIERTHQLQQEKTRLAASVNSLSAGFIMTDSANRLVIINPNAKRLLLGETKPSRKAVGLDQIQQSFGDTLDFAGNITQCLKTKKTIEISELLFGSLFLHLYFTPIIDTDGKAIGAVILVQDVTEEKVLQRSKDEFFSIASHELRTPLTAIRGNTSMIQSYYADAIKDPSLKEMIGDIHNSSIRLIEIVNDFLDASRLEQGKVEFKQDVFNVDKIIESVVYEMAGVSREKKIYIKTDNSLDKLPPVCADPDKVKQIIYNLVGNAMKFTETGGITIKPVAEKAFLRIQIVDTGKGIPADKQSLLFHKFQQAGSSLFTRDTTRGTGLGLYISKLLAEKMGGKVSLDKSEQGKGSVFSFTIPLAATDQKDQSSS